MIHLTNRLTIDTYSALLQFILSFICLFSSFTALLLFPGVRHHRWRLLYLLKVLYVTFSMGTVLGSQWWFDWYCGKVSSTEHYSALIQDLVPTTLILHIGLDGLRIDYTAKLSNKVLTYQSFSRIAYDGLHFTNAIDEYDDKVTKLQTHTPLPVRWVLDQFKQTVEGPQFGFNLHNKAFYTSQLLWFSLLCLSIGWCFVKFSDTMHGFALIILGGILQILSALVYSCYHSAPAKVFVGNKVLLLHFGESYYHILTSGCLQVLLGCSLVLTSQFVPCVNRNIFRVKKVEFIEPISRMNSIKKRFSSYHADTSTAKDSTSSKCSKKLKNSCKRLRHYSNSIGKREEMSIPIVIRNSEGTKQFDSGFSSYGSTIPTDSLTPSPNSRSEHIHIGSNTSRVHWKVYNDEASGSSSRSSAIKYVINVEDCSDTDPELTIVMPETNI